MRRTMRRIGTGLLWTFIVLLLLPAVVPPFLDRVYYRGAPTDHYDGQRFFNPEGEYGTGGSQKRTPIGWMLRFLSGGGRAVWPDHVAVTPAVPAARVDGARMVVTWVGHATVLVQTQGLNILTDPIWSDHAGPFGVTGPTRVRAPGIDFARLPKIDVVLVSHNHYDHMDLATLKHLWERDKPLIVTSLGNDAVIAGAGAKAVTRDWGGRVPVRPGVEVIVERVHHWGSRWMRDRNRALWSGFTVTLPGGNLFFAGDTGFGDGSWPIAAAKDGPYRLAIIPIGAFRPREVMSGNHIGPVEAVEVFRRLGAARALAVHWGTFQLSEEGIDEPPAVLRAELKRRGIAEERFRAIDVGKAWDVPALPPSITLEPAAPRS
jgi:L-ascorbate metabolism protein UlaG (beta-lactamase superfamily)